MRRGEALATIRAFLTVGFLSAVLGEPWSFDQICQRLSAGDGPNLIT